MKTNEGILSNRKCVLKRKRLCEHFIVSNNGGELFVSDDTNIFQYFLSKKQMRRKFEGHKKPVTKIFLDQKKKLLYR